MSLSEVKYTIAESQALYASKNKKGCYVSSGFAADYVLKVAKELGLKLEKTEASNSGFMIVSRR